jgi:anti-sigma regulatory factor (Ser/Thr protein kinase)/predicted GIY-YIG superfamily endonuclease
VDHVPGTVYLLHLNQPYKHARHYLGWAADLDARLAQHAAGSGARLLQVVRQAGIGWELARTWPGDRYRERQLKKQGGRSRMCPVCKQQPRKKAMEPTATPGQHRQEQAGDVIRAELPADLTSARQARAAIRQALTAWGLADPDGDAELLASELAANASEHGRGPITLAVRRHAEPGRQPALTCEVTDASPQVPRPREAGPGEERGRGLAIVTALATSSGVRATQAGKTTWFTLALRERAGRLTRQPEPEAEAGA